MRFDDITRIGIVDVNNYVIDRHRYMEALICPLLITEFGKIIYNC